MNNKTVAPIKAAKLSKPWAQGVLRPTNLAMALLVLVVASLPLLPFANSYLLAIVVRILLFVALGQAWNVIAGIGGQMSLGHGVFFGIGAYATGMFFNSLNISPWVGGLLAVVISAFVALLVGAVTFRLRGIYFALATVVISLAFEKITRYYAAVTGGDTGLAIDFRGTEPMVMQWREPAAFLWIALVLVTCYFVATKWLLRSEFGLALQAVRDDEEAAASSGVNVQRIKLIAFILSAAMTSLAGTLHLQFYLTIDPGTAFGLSQAIQIQLPALIGGLATAGGPVIGGAIMVLLSEGTNILSSRMGLHGVDVLVYGLILLLIVLKAPTGILGLFKKKRASQQKNNGHEKDSA
jgi:branched-chain amino acid transport system permease protein